MTDEVIERVARAMLDNILHRHQDLDVFLEKFASYPEKYLSEMADDAVEAYEQSLRPGDTLGEYVVQGWQPIETAPRDGTVVLIVPAPINRVCGDVRAACFIHGARLVLDKSATREPSWMDADGEYAPTHWMPLPPAPALTTEDSTDA